MCGYPGEFYLKVFRSEQPNNLENINDNDAPRLALGVVRCANSRLTVLDRRLKCYGKRSMSPEKVDVT